MSTIDIRDKESNSINLIRFSGSDCGMGKAALLRRYSTGQFVIIHNPNDSSDLCHVKFEDVDNLILALKEAKKLWG